MFRSRERNQSITTPSAYSSSASSQLGNQAPSSSSYPPLDEKHKKFSPHDSVAETGDTTSGVFQDEASSSRFSGSDSPAQDQRLIKALAAQAYHLPGYSYWQDWKQYCVNNHPMFGICFHHPLHPIGWGMRALCFVASVVFGLVITNIVWLWAESLEDNSAVFAVNVGEQAQRSVNVTQYLIDINEENQIEVTKDMIVLWTFGGALHALFDNTIWQMTICSVCDPGGKYEHLHKYKRYGVGLLSFFVLAVAAIATLSVVLRAAMENEAEVQMKELRSAGLMDDAVDFKSQNKESYEFLMSYSVELAVALLFHFPVIGFILFSGCLNVKGKLPILGGRPYEVLQEEEELAGLTREVDSETGEPIKRKFDNTTNKEQSVLLNSGGQSGDDNKQSKRSGMAKFWDSKGKATGSDIASTTSRSNSMGNRGPKGASSSRKEEPSRHASIPSSRRMSAGSVQSSKTNSTGGPRSSSSYTQRRGSAGSNYQPRRGSTGSRSGTQQTPASPVRNSRPANASATARSYTGGRIYIPQQQPQQHQQNSGSSGRIVSGRSGPPSPSSRSRGRPQGIPQSALSPAVPGSPGARSTRRSSENGGTMT